MDLHHIQEARKIFNACGYHFTDRSGQYVPLVKSFLLPMVLSPNQSAIWTLQIDGDTVWSLRAISCDQGMASITGVRLQIQLPSGRFIFGGNGVDVGQFAWVGSYRYNEETEQDIEPGSKFSVTLADGNTGGLANPLAVNLLFEGSFKYYFRSTGGAAEPDLATSIPRYQGIVNENILAPSWRAGYGPPTPPGYEDEYYVYSILNPGNVNTATIALGGPLTATQTVVIDDGADFICRRVLVDLEPGSSVSAGNVVIRLRTGDGYALMDDYVDVAKYFAAAEWLGDWKIRAGDQVTADIALVDSAGTGNMVVTIHLEGVRRTRRASAA